MKKISIEYIFVAGVGILILYFYSIGELTKPRFLLLSGIGILFLLAGLSNPRKISLEEARKIAYDFVSNEQKDGRVGQGTIKLLPQSELKYILSLTENPTLEPMKYSVGIIIEGLKRYYYVVDVSIYGVITGFHEVQAKPDIKKIEPDIRVVEGKVKSEVGDKDEQNKDISNV